ncbi:hypothetical protein DET50_12022 [Marinobacter pelagius]|uniref:Uncharacterized protein n=1 Tax=Marinobacter pelagius TaxID=379482 RepID=A0A366GJ75_9GAMM|nr:hypothetical protein [Marinobacter pelagius]RBP25973.1 hypothetical protein DET50_12022 [Marinobacter pelagius]
MSQYDTLIVGGRYFDGSPNPSRIADAGIRDGRIHAVAVAGAHIRNMAFYNLPLRFLKLVYESQQQDEPVMSLERAGQH